MSEHILTVKYEGSWKKDFYVEEDNPESGIRYGDDHSHQPSVTSMVECSCGRTFDNKLDGVIHLEEVIDEMIERKRNLIGGNYG